MNAVDSIDKRRARVAGALVAVALLLLPVRVCFASRIEGVDFADRVSVGGVDFKLNSVALLRYMVFIKAYVGGLYLGPGADPQSILADTPKRLEISYFWEISAEDFQSATREAILRNIGQARYAKISASVDQFNALYKTVKPGDRYALTYVPGVGTELALNGKPLGTVPGAEFSAGVFSIWFGDEEVDSDFKEALLAKKR